MSEKDVEIVVRRVCKMHDSGQYTWGEITMIDLAVPKSTITDTFGVESLKEIKLQDKENTSQYESQVLLSAKNAVGFNHE
jgi:hypothetical protein